MFVSWPRQLITVAHENDKDKNNDNNNNNDHDDHNNNNNDNDNNNDSKHGTTKDVTPSTFINR